MKIEVCTHYDVRRQMTGDFCSGIMRKYCEKHGYKFRMCRENNHPIPTFNKILTVQQSGADWILWLDSDCLIFRDDFRVEDLCLSHDLSIAQDSNGACAGAFLLRNCEWSQSLLSAWLFLGPMPTDCRKGDQDTLKLILRCGDVAAHVMLIPESVISNPWAIPTPRPFVHHYCASGKDQTRLAFHMIKDNERGFPTFM